MLNISLGLLTLIIQEAPAIISLWNTATSNDSFGTKLNSLSKPLGSFVTDLGSQLFPKAAPALHIVGGAIAAFNTDYTKWLQGSLNELSPALGLPNPNLVVDGHYGPLTRAAVEACQAHYGIVVDGLAGNITQGWIAKGLAALPRVA